MHAKELKLAAFVQNGSGDLGEISTRVCKAADLIGGRAPEPSTASRAAGKPASPKDKRKDERAMETFKQYKEEPYDA